jgi:hypothetical protein
MYCSTARVEAWRRLNAPQQLCKLKLLWPWKKADSKTESKLTKAKDESAKVAVLRDGFAFPAASNRKPCAAPLLHSLEHHLIFSNSSRNVRISILPD